MAGVGVLPPAGRAHHPPGRRGGAPPAHGRRRARPKPGDERSSSCSSSSCRSRGPGRALILAFDSSFPFDVGERRPTRRAEPFSLWNYDYTRIPSIMEHRASTYQALFFAACNSRGCSPTTRPCVWSSSAMPTRQWQPAPSDLPVGNDADRMPRREPLAAYTISCALIVNRGALVRPGEERNWLQSVPGKGAGTPACASTARWQPWFDKTWRPGEIELVK